MGSGRDAEPFAPSIAPWLAVEDAEKAVAYYSDAFGAVELYRLAGEDGKVVVAQLSVGGAVLWVQQDPETRPDAESRAAIRLILSVEDPDTVFARSVATGAATVSPVSEEHGWRTGRISDPFGHQWEISRQLS
ncbi:MAG: glyoxalase [Candidatus Nephthysia bennettiae]|uniref:VOC family protein n=2 Tax=Candidatus Nephthysia bennettiae TaxID=3127016 RepID=A0A934K1G5_9BACT|nr:VOC family protein [Candidatus Dormibacteraeota bacterium]MBJ7614343.1 VOC family protein [Candidatus Dormibacteraeota bacterium]PZR85967.1 MAG: glyoxalase [Candidatus Dormibacteraeota bacterium]